MLGILADGGNQVRNVNGDDADPLFKYLKKTQKGILGSEKIKWNFTKFLINRDGKACRISAKEALKIAEGK